MIVALIIGVSLWMIGRAIERASNRIAQHITNTTHTTYTDNRQYHYHQTEVHNYAEQNEHSRSTDRIRF